MGKDNSSTSPSSPGWGHNQIILFLMGAIFGVGIGFAIGNHSKDVGRNINITSDPYEITHAQRRIIANIDPSMLLRGKDFTLPPTENVDEIRPLPTPKPSSSQQPTRKHSSESYKNPTTVPTPVNMQEVATRRPSLKPTLSAKVR